MDTAVLQLPQGVGQVEPSRWHHFQSGRECKGSDELLKEGLIQRFEYTHELAWKVMKDYAEYQGYTDVRGSRDALRQALQMGLINDAVWMDSIEDRNLISHN